MDSKIVYMILGTVILALLLSLVFILRTYFQKCNDYEIQMIQLKRMNQLYSLWERGSERQLKKFFCKYNIESVAIYGMGKAGKILYDELKKTSVEVRYAIDQNPNRKYKDLQIVSPKSDLPEVDLVIITALYEYNAIARELRKKMNCLLLSLEQILV